MPGDSPGVITRRLDVDALAGTDPVGAFVLIPDPDGPGRAAALRRAVATETAVLGPTVAPREAHRSLRWARTALDLLERGAIPLSHPVHVKDQLGALILLRDEELARAFTTSRLKPLLELPDGERERLLDTLRAWLDHQRHTPAVAAELHVHPQTVRYRLGRLRELLGTVLETPAGRFELEMALRARAAFEA
jgi:DNA-binding PucR family transcriptional regulator